MPGGGPDSTWHEGLMGPVGKRLKTLRKTLCPLLSSWFQLSGYQRCLPHPDFAAYQICIFAAPAAAATAVTKMLNKSNLWTDGFN